MKAVWNGEVIAESDEANKVEGYYYFPLASVRMDFLKPSNGTSSCYLKGTANYFHIKAGKKRLENGAWQYKYPSDAVKTVRDRIAFDDDVDIVD